MKNSLILAGTSVFALAMVAACTPASDAPEPAPSEDAAGPTIEDARAFIENAEETLANLNKETAPIYWEQATNITPETNAAATRVFERACY